VVYKGLGSSWENLTAARRKDRSGKEAQIINFKA